MLCLMFVLLKLDGLRMLLHSCRLQYHLAEFDIFCELNNEMHVRIHACSGLRGLFHAVMRVPCV